jgi:hypothetical protein
MRFVIRKPMNLPSTIVAQVDQQLLDAGGLEGFDSTVHIRLESFIRGWRK